ncbi:MULTISPECIES: hypothetical protein [unclassified Saccharothrix]|uniref:hypothetical protein n=1 Tax=unclassified Saccharothrix TaxID=2593673 RepID=UPI00307D3562
MALLPAVVPLVVEKRSELVPARLARKVAPLFGVPSEQNPFRPLTWVCDFTTITASEIARGAPLPTRAAQARLREREHDGEWVVHDRAVLPTSGRALPNEIVPATVNRFGPDTKAAVVLTATNVLLAPVTEAITAALPLLRGGDGGELPTVQWIAAWAATAVEVYRSQPALVVAAVKARAIQRESLSAPLFPWADRLAGRPKARCEIGAVPPDPHDPVTRPRDLDFLDGVAVARLNSTGALPSSGRGTGPGVGDRLVELLISLMVDMGAPDSAGYVWVSEREPGQAVVEAMVPSSGLVRELVETWAHGPGSLARPDEFADALADAIARPVRLPAPAEVAALPVLGRRAVVLAAMGIVRQMGLLAPSSWVTGPEFAGLLDGVEALLSTVDPGDPLVPETRLRLAVQRAGVERHTGRAGADTVAALLSAADACLASEALDRGTLADILAVTCVELNMLRPFASAPLTDALRRYWTAFAEAVEVDLSTPDADHSALSFQLHNYAAFLGGNNDSEADLRASLHLFTHSVIPGRTRLFNRDRDFRPLARSLYLAADAAASLAVLVPAEAGQWVRTAHDWVRRVLANPGFAPGRLHPRLDDSLFALRAAPVLLLAVETGVAPERESALSTADELIRLVERWLKATADGGNSSYHATVTALRSRLTTLLASSTGP